MKTILKIVSLTLLIAIAIRCSKDSDGDPAQNLSTYINYSFTGNQINNTFNIEVDDLSNLNTQAYGTIFPESDSETLKRAVMVFLDNSQSINVTMSIPGRTGLVEILDDHPDFDMEFGFDDIGLEAKSISVNVEEIERDDINVIHIKATFEGVAVYKTQVNGDDIEETHLVNGEFEYNIPQ